MNVLPVMAALLISGFMGMLSETALNMALSQLMKEFGISPSAAQWLTTGYLLVLGILIPVSGLLIKRFTTRRLFITSLCFSITGLLVAAVSPTFGVLLSGRIIQAIGTGLLVSLLFHTVLILFPPWKRGTAMGIVGLVMMFAPAIGPISAGLVIDYLNWHMIFWFILPFMVFALLFGILFLPNLTTPVKQKIDILSIVLSTIGFGGIVFGFSFAGESGGWSSPVVLSALTAGAAAIGMYAVRQLTIPEPVLNLNVFRQPMFILGIVITLFANIIIFSANILLPLYMQTGLGLAASSAGLLLLPGGIVNGLMSMISGRIFDKHGPRALLITGFVMSTAAVWFFSTVTSATSPYLIIFFFMLLMVSMSMVTTPSQTNGINQLSPDLYPDGSAVVNSMIQTSGAIGTALAISIMNATQRHYLSGAAHPASAGDLSQALISGVQNAFSFALIISVIGFVCSLFVRRVMVR
ncbi:DHA2 family efflux MFS transporter permease subunit [Sporosarcina trichiuri]|uniref:DHA2 family efflux MFS transporter permease subunit n=1 Tax=Sporosarcina trichiuri TaxID=3056445 RepID=UPI0025B5681E|nr:DHA2 family efflux MFS transporter permease subunit [Sporosarcina sp. 0.2-SM1T-5]WJY28933.1 DHA2 family efflux MFS transporter permease subunit [Sporosarcina sp. 0.2-SM1T-5]